MNKFSSPNSERLFQRLAKAKELMDRAGDNCLSGAIEAILAVDEFVRREHVQRDNSTSEIREAMKPVHMLFSALMDVQDGAQNPMFKPASGERGQSIPTRAAMLSRGYAAAAAELLFANGMTREAAYAFVAKRLDRAGVRQTSGKPITAGTVKSWLKRQRNHEVEDLEYLAFESHASKKVLATTDLKKRADHALDLVCDSYGSLMKTQTGEF